MVYILVGVQPDLKYHENTLFSCELILFLDLRASILFRKFITYLALAQLKRF